MKYGLHFKRLNLFLATPCEELNIPRNGARICNGWEMGYGRVCMMACQDGFTLPSSDSYEKLYVCGASGNWMYPAPMPNCSGKYKI